METTQLAKLATAVVVDEKTYKLLCPDLPTGVSTVDVRVRIAGALKKGLPYEQNIAAAANPWALLAKALSKLNSATIESIVAESLAVTDEETEAVKKAAVDAIAKLVAATKRTMPGRVTNALSWELVG